MDLKERDGLTDKQVKELSAKQVGEAVLEIHPCFYDGKSVTFGLACGGKACGVKYQRDLSVRSYRDGESTRTLRFV